MGIVDLDAKKEAKLESYLTGARSAQFVLGLARQDEGMFCWCSAGRAQFGLGAARGAPDAREVI